MADDLAKVLGLKLDEVLRFRDILGDETDRGCALTAAAYLDTELGSLLRDFLVNDKTVANRLLDPDRPVGSFSARIDLAYMLGLIPHLAARDLHLIRKIRNHFAHDPWDAIVWFFLYSFSMPGTATRHFSGGPATKAAIHARGHGGRGFHSHCAGY